MRRTERRGADLGQPARGPGRLRGGVGRRGDRFRRFTQAGVAAALAIVSRHTERALPDDRAQVVREAEDVRLPGRDRAALDALIDEAAAAHGISAHLVRAVVETESAFDPSAVSPVGAQGLMQLMPATARHMGVTDPFDPRQNLFGGTRYLSQLIDRFDGDVALALAGYNAGPTRVARRGIPPYGETHGYVARVRRLLAASTGVHFPLPKPVVIRSVRRSDSSRGVPSRRVTTLRLVRRPGGRRRA